MDIIKVIEHLYINPKCDWINELSDEDDIEPFVIQKWLAMNDMLRVQVRWLDKYVYSLPPKMYLSLAWSIIPKVEKVPFTKYIKKVEEVEEFDFILNKIRKQFKLSDNDYKYAKDRILSAIKNNMADWFIYYGIEKKYWKLYQLNFDQIKKTGGQPKPIKSLAAWGL